MTQPEIDRLSQRAAAYEMKIAALVARTWDDIDPEITDSTRAAAQALGMGAGEVWRVLEVWTACAGQESVHRRLSRFQADDTETM